MTNIPRKPSDHEALRLQEVYEDIRRRFREQLRGEFDPTLVAELIIDIVNMKLRQRLYTQGDLIAFNLHPETKYFQATVNQLCNRYDQDRDEAAFTGGLDQALNKLISSGQLMASKHMPPSERPGAMELELAEFFSEISAAANQPVAQRLMLGGAAGLAGAILTTTALSAMAAIGVAIGTVGTLTITKPNKKAPKDTICQELNLTDNWNCYPRSVAGRTEVTLTAKQLKVLECTAEEDGLSVFIKEQPDNTWDTSWYASCGDSFETGIENDVASAQDALRMAIQSAHRTLLTK